MAQELTANLITEYAEPGKESYEINWTIPNWRVVRASDDLVNCQEAVFETASSPSAWFKTRWLVGLKVFSCGYNKNVRMYWKLLGITGPQTMKLEAKLQTKLWNFSTKEPSYINEKSQEVKLLQVVEEEVHDFLPIRHGYLLSTDTLISCLGGLKYVLELTLNTPTMCSVEYDRFKMEQFSKKSVERQRQNQAALLNDRFENSDLKVFTSDGVEIAAHKNILTAQCPVFAAMLNCDLSENATGVIRMTDITGKTMKLLLHYFYTGELLPSWRDPDTIVEFTYAAGKYQMVEVLELLDDMLGRNFKGDASNLDVQLINLAGKLELVNAEARLLKRIVAKIKQFRRGSDLFRLFGFKEEEISEMAEMLRTEQVGDSKVLKLVDHLFGSYDSKNFYEKGLCLLAFVLKEGMRMVEEKLLQSFERVAEHVENSEQLFSLFGREKQMGK